jgi:ATPase subunit of ABC transporter with duplicated ATPase domains
MLGKLSSGRILFAPMIALQEVTKLFGSQVVLAEASLQLNPGEKVGLVGPNGSGKSTIFRLLMGEEQPEGGEVSVPKRLAMAHFRQDAGEASALGVIDQAVAGCGRLGNLHVELAQLEAALEDPEQVDQLDRLLERFGEVQADYAQHGGYELLPRAREVLHGLGFEDSQIDGPMSALSGGWRMRVSIAQVLIGSPDVLLLDEPTNHLDIESILWLEGYLKQSPAAILMTCHDRDFMDRVVTRIIEIDEGQLVSHSGDYASYEHAKAMRASQNAAAFARQQAMIKKEERFIERFEKHAAKAAQVQSRVKKLDKIEKLEPPKKRILTPFEFRQPPRSGNDVVTLSQIGKRYGERPIYQSLDFEIKRGERWCVMGINGAGKSTLLKLIAGVIQPDSGQVKLGASLKMGYFAQSALEVLDPNSTVWEQIDGAFPMATIPAKRTLLGAFDFPGDDIEKPIRVLSGGERSRLVLAQPTNHLDLDTKEMLIKTLSAFDGTMIFVSHDRSFLRGMSNRVLDLSGGGEGVAKEPLRFLGPYEAWVERTGHEAPGVRR